MKHELINDLFSKFEQAKRVINDMECWSARDIQVHLGYTEWRNFAKVIEKAKIACPNAGGETVNHFVDLNKMIDIGHGTQRDVQEVDFKRWEEETCEEIGLKIDQTLTG